MCTIFCFNINSNTFKFTSSSFKLPTSRVRNDELYLYIMFIYMTILTYKLRYAYI